MKGEMVRFLLVGVLNTVAGYLIFLGGYWGLGLNAYLANMLAYLIVVIAAYFLTAKFVFRRQIVTSGFLQFIICFFIAFSINQVVLMSAVELTPLRPEIAQVFAMGSYTCVFFVLNKWVVFKADQSQAEAVEQNSG